MKRQGGSVLSAATSAVVLTAPLLHGLPACCRRLGCRGSKATTQDCNGHHGLWAAASSNMLFTE